MTHAQAQIVNVTTASDGSATAYSDVVEGHIASIAYVKDGTVPFADTVDFAITTEVTTQGLWTESNVTASKTVAPRQPTHDQSGAAALYAESGVAVGGPIFACVERIKIVIAEGGNAKRGQFRIVIA